MTSKELIAVHKEISAMYKRLSELRTNHQIDYLTRGRFDDARSELLRANENLRQLIGRAAIDEAA